MRSKVNQQTNSSQVKSENDFTNIRKESLLDKEESKETRNGLLNDRSQNAANSGEENPNPRYSGVQNFANISILPSHRFRLQPKLKINPSNDKYEQEADRVAEQVMRMPEQKLQHKCAKCRKEEEIQSTSGVKIQRKCTKCEEEEEMLQTKSKGNSPNMASSALMNQIQHTRGGGQALDTNTRSFMESRFGMDFSGVRIHDNTQAAEMNQKINAGAFTIGRDIYFNQGRYQPKTVEGRMLLAHELVHVRQQRFDKIQRKIYYQKPTPVEKDPLKLALENKKLGKTYASYNNEELPDGDVRGAINIIKGALHPWQQKATEKGPPFFVKVLTSGISVNTSARMETITPPTNNGVWKGYIPTLPLPSRLNSPCRHKHRPIPVEMSSKINNLYNTVLIHEEEHWKDIKNLTHLYISQAHSMILGIIGKGNSEEEAERNWDTKYKSKENMETIEVPIKSFLKELAIANKKYDDSNGTHHHKAEYNTK